MISADIKQEMKKNFRLHLARYCLLKTGGRVRKFLLNKQNLLCMTKVISSRSLGGWLLSLELKDYLEKIIFLQGCKNFI